MSAPITETITPTATQGPDLVGEIVSSSFPATVVPGETGTIKIRLTNQGNAAAIGSITNGLYLSLDASLDTSDVAVTLKGGLSRARVKLNPAQSVLLTGTFAIPADLSVGTYYPLVWLDQTASLVESTSTNNVVTPGSSYDVADAFGTVAGRSGVTLQLKDGQGTPGVFRLTGPGSGSVSVGDNGLDVSLTGTTTASVLSITGKGTYHVHDISAGTTVGAIRAPGVAVDDSLDLVGGAGSVQVSGISGGGQIFLGSGPTSTLSLGSVSNTSLTAASGIRSLAVTEWSNGSRTAITAPWIGTLSSKGDFTPSLNLSGADAPAGTALQSAGVNGALGAVVWSVVGAVTRLRAGSVPGGWSGNVSGSVKSLTVGGSFAGRFAAASFSSVAIAGDVTAADILAGANFGPDGRLGFGDDTFAGGTIGSLRVNGSITGSVIAAGLIPGKVSLLGTGASLASDSSIHSVSINGNTDSSGRILAALLPRRGRVNGQSIDPSTDPRFELGG